MASDTPNCDFAAVLRTKGEALEPPSTPKPTPRQRIEEQDAGGLWRVAHLSRGLGQQWAPRTTDCPRARKWSSLGGSGNVAQDPVSSPKVNLRPCASCVLLGGPWRCMNALCRAPGCDAGRKHASCPGPCRRGLQAAETEPGDAPAALVPPLAARSAIFWRTCVAAGPQNRSRARAQP